MDVPHNRSWYPFQLAFILLNLPGITKLDHPDRSEESSAAADLLWFLPARRMCNYLYATIEYLKAVRCPLLVVHSRQDGLIPYHHGTALFEAAAEPKQFLEIRGHHADGFYTSGELYLSGVRAFLDQHVTGRQ